MNINALTMDATEVLKNVHCFISEIIPKAYCFQNWNEETIIVAVELAALCEQISETFINQPNGDDLDELVRLISKTVNKNEESVIGLADLKSSTALLTKAFFENPHIENEVFLTVLNEIQKNESSDQLLKETTELNSMCSDLVEALKPLSSYRAGKSIYHEVKAEILLEYLKTATSQMNTEEEVESYLTFTIESLCENEDKMFIMKTARTSHMLLQLVFVHILSIETEDKCQEMKEIQEFCVNWLLLRIASENTCPLANFIWRQPTIILSTLASKHLPFYNYYACLLTKHTNALKLSEDGVHWKAEHTSSDGVILTFDDILRHLKGLLSTDGLVSKATKGFLLSEVNKHGKTSVWPKIYELVR